LKSILSLLIEYGSICQNGSVNLLADSFGHRILPSHVALAPSGPYSGLKRDDNTIRQIRRILGRKYSDPEVASYIQEHPSLTIKNQTDTPVIVSKFDIQGFKPEQITSVLLRQLKKRAEEHLASPVTHAIVAVPVYFNDQQRQAIKTAGSLAGLNILRVINEPTAAIMAYGLDKKYDQTGERIVLVCSCSIQNCDITLLSIEEMEFEVLYASSISLSNTQPIHSISRATEGLALDFQRDCNTAKEQIQDIIMVGGEHLHRRIGDLLEEQFPAAMIVEANFNAEEAIVRGAAMQGAMQASTQPGPTIACFSGLLHNSVGVEISGGLMEAVIGRHSYLPIQRSKVLTTAIADQTSMTVRLFEGDRLFTENNRFLGQLEMDLNSSADLPQIEIRLVYNADEDLTMHMRQLGTSNNAELFIPAKCRHLSTDELHAMIEEGERYWQDMPSVILAEQSRAVEVRARTHSEGIVPYQTGKPSMAAQVARAPRSPDEL